MSRFDSFCALLQTSNLLNPVRNRENTEAMIDRKPVVKPIAGRPRGVLGNISNKAAPPARTEGTKVAAVVFFDNVTLNDSVSV